MDCVDIDRQIIKGGMQAMENGGKFSIKYEP